MALRIAMVISGLVLFLLGGCAPTALPVHDWDEAWSGRHADRRLDLPGFLALAPDAVAARRAEAVRYRATADRARHHVDRVRCLDAVTALCPDDARAWLDLAVECERAGDSDRALACVVAAQSALPRIPAVDRADIRFDAALRRAWIHRDRGQWVLAHAWADSAVSWRPGEREARMLQGLCRAAHGDASGAVNLARDIEIKQFSWFEWRWIRGMAEAGQGRDRDAYHWLETARPEWPWHGRFWRDLAEVCERLGDAVQAERFHRYAFDALDLPPGTAMEFRCGVPGPDGAVLDLPLWRAYDHLPAAGSDLGWALAASDSALALEAGPMKDRWADTASGLLSRCIRTENRVDLCRERRGLLYAEMGALDLAKADLNRLVVSGGQEALQDPRALAWYGRFLIEGRRWREAMPVLQRAVEGIPDHARAWGDLGLALLVTGREEEGEQALGLALELDPDLAAAWFNRGLARYLDKRWDEAVADLEQALDLAPDNVEVRELLQQAAQRARQSRR